MKNPKVTSNKIFTLPPFRYCRKLDFSKCHVPFNWSIRPPNSHEQLVKTCHGSMRFQFICNLMLGKEVNHVLHAFILEVKNRFEKEDKRMEYLEEQLDILSSWFMEMQVEKVGQLPFLISIDGRLIGDPLENNYNGNEVYTETQGTVG